jgi:hypothetical protein
VIAVVRVRMLHDGEWGSGVELANGSGEAITRVRAHVGLHSYENRNGQWIWRFADSVNWIEFLLAGERASLTGGLDPSSTWLAEHV